MDGGEGGRFLERKGTEGGRRKRKEVILYHFFSLFPCNLSEIIIINITMTTIIIIIIIIIDIIIIIIIVVVYYYYRYYRQLVYCLQK